MAVTPLTAPDGAGDALAAGGADAPADADGATDAEAVERAVGRAVGLVQRNVYARGLGMTDCVG